MPRDLFITRRRTVVSHQFYEPGPEGPVPVEITPDEMVEWPIVNTSHEDPYLMHLGYQKGDYLILKGVGRLTPDGFYPRFEIHDRRIVRHDDDGWTVKSVKSFE